MSSLAAVQADGYYHPPEWDPQKEGRDRFQNSKGSNQYQQYGVIRFEMPHHSWCEGCGRHIARGTRFNSKKDRDGKYYTTTIWRFTMKCPSCSNELVIRTDPQNTDYEFFSGIRRKIQGFDSAAEGEAEALPDPDATVAAAADPMLQLENAQRDKKVADTRTSALQRLIDKSESLHAEDYAANAYLRRQNRSKRKEEKALKEEAEKLGLGFPLALPSPADDAAAARVRFSRQHPPTVTVSSVATSSSSGRQQGSTSIAEAAARYNVSKVERERAAKLALARRNSPFGGDMIRTKSLGSGSGDGSCRGTRAAQKSDGARGKRVRAEAEAAVAANLRLLKAKAVRNPRHETVSGDARRGSLVGVVLKRRRTSSDEATASAVSSAK